jgi:hypothetical protein
MYNLLKVILMKKLLLIACTIALFCVAGAAHAQQQDQRSNQYRNTPQSQQQTDTTATDNDQNAMQAGQQESEVEVVESKEGPNSEVVYKFQGELFYVDRDEKKLVKADESELKEATHKTIVKDNTAKDNKRSRDN